MTYWRALEERSRILWQTLFRQSTLIEQSVPVYINTRSALKGAEGEGQAALQPPAPEESAWTAGAEAEALRQPPAQENTAAAVWARPAARKETLEDVEERTLPDLLRAGTERVESTFGYRVPGGGNAFTPASGDGAAQLLKKLRQIERSSAPPARQDSYAAAEKENERGRLTAEVEMADWSAWLERDARRYDGGFELM